MSVSVLAIQFFMCAVGQWHFILCFEILNIS